MLQDVGACGVHRIHFIHARVNIFNMMSDSLSRVSMINESLHNICSHCNPNMFTRCSIKLLIEFYRHVNDSCRDYNIKKDLYGSNQ